MAETPELLMPHRRLLGGRPSSTDPRVLRALTTPLVGQFDPAFTAIMDEVAGLGRQAFGSASARCVPVSGLPRAALEAVLNTLLEPGHRVVSTSELVARLARPYGLRVEVLAGEAPGEVLSRDALADSLEREPARLVAVTHVDPISGARQPLPGLAEVCRAHGAFLLVDATLSLGGCELRFDAWDLDIAVAGFDGCLGGPAGLSPVVYTAAVEAALTDRARRLAPRTSYLDLVQLQAYWSPERLNHHTAPTSLVYGAREALRLALVEGLEARWERHRRIAAGLHAGLAALGLRLLAPPAQQSPVLCALAPFPELPEVRRRLRDEYGQILGPHGQLGLVGHQARPDTLLSLLGGLEQALLALGQNLTPGAARAAALGAL